MFFFFVKQFLNQSLLTNFHTHLWKWLALYSRSHETLQQATQRRHELPANCSRGCLSSPATCTMQGCGSHIVVHMLSASSPTNLLLSGVWSSAGFKSHSLVCCSLILRNGPRWANHCRLRTFTSSCSLYLCDYHTPVKHVLESKKYVSPPPPNLWHRAWVYSWSKEAAESMQLNNWHYVEGNDNNAGFWFFFRLKGEWSAQNSSTLTEDTEESPPVDFELKMPFQPLGLNSWQIRFFFACSTVKFSSEKCVCCFF